MSPHAPLRSTLVLANNRHQKQYNAEVVPSGDGYLVNFAFGAIGKSLAVGTKTKVPVSYEQAVKVYEKLIAEKTGKRCECCGGSYLPREYQSASPSPSAQCTRVINPESVRASPPSSGPRFVPELLAPCDGDSKRYIESDFFGAQRKYDGVRLAVDYCEGGAVGYNRKGEPVPVPTTVVATLDKLLRMGLIKKVFLDGEWLPQVGEYVAFDLLEVEGMDFRQEPYTERYALLKELGEVLNVATLFIGTTQKFAALLDEREGNGEGLVFKKLSAPYMPGRQGINVKLKLWASATVRVCAKKKEDGKNSFATEVLRDGTWWACGTVTCTKTRQIPESGTYREIKYLYVGNGGRLYQPEDLGPRTDVDDSDCDWAQLKIKQEAKRLAA